MELLGKSPAARWIGNKFLPGGTQLLQKCMRCGAEQLMELPSGLIRDGVGARGVDVPIDFDEKLYDWKKTFQLAHENCVE